MVFESSEYVEVTLVFFVSSLKEGLGSSALLELFASELLLLLSSPRLWLSIVRSHSHSACCVCAQVAYSCVGVCWIPGPADFATHVTFILLLPHLF